MTNLNLTLITEAEIEYRSSSLNPDNWCSALAKDDEGNTYKVWFEMVNDSEDLEDCCNWDDLSDNEPWEEM